MSKTAKSVLKFFLVIVLIAIVGFLFAFVLPIYSFIHAYGKQMSAGQKYMNSLNEKDFQVWATRTQKYLSEFDPKADSIGSNPDIS